jgi:hypothetical protein
MSAERGSGVEYNDLPALFRSADGAANTAHRQYSLITTTNLILILVSAILGSLFVGGETTARETITVSMTIVGAIVLSACVILTAVTQMLHLEQVWHDGRAVAESVKTLAWRYMMGCEPYSQRLDMTRAQNLFLSDLSSLLEARTSFASRLGGTPATMPQITSRMRDVRSLDLENRKKVYLTARLDDQVNWYANRAERSRKSSGRLFFFMIVSLIAAIIAAILIINWPGSPVNPIGFLVNLALAFLTWLERGRHEELAQSYGIAAQELGLIRERLAVVATDEQLSEFVSDAEKAVSREHTLWLARSDRR